MTSMRTASGWRRRGTDLETTGHALLLQCRDAGGEPSAPALRHRIVKAVVTAAKEPWTFVMRRTSAPFGVSLVTKVD